MTEKEKMQSQKLYDANYDSELERERIECKALCQEYNHLPIKETEKRSRLIKKILGKTGEKIHIEPDFWCDYGYCISAGENFYANHGLVVLDAGGVAFGDNVFVAPNCGFHTSGHPIDFERRNRGLEYAYPIKVGNNVWFGAGVQVMPGVTIGSKGGRFLCGAKILRKSSGKIRDPIFQYFIERNFGTRGSVKKRQ